MNPGFRKGGEGWVGQQKKHLEKAAVFAQKKIKVEKKKENESLAPIVLQKLAKCQACHGSSKSQKLHSSLPSKQHGMCLPTASLSKHEDCTNTAITCCLHNFCCRMFVNPLVAGSMSKCLVKLEGMMTSNEVNHWGSGKTLQIREPLSCLCPEPFKRGLIGTQEIPT